jgi:hypothetical protein
MMANLQPRKDGAYMAPDDPGEPGTLKPRISVTDAEGEILRELVRGLEVLEIGTGLGVATRYMAQSAAHVWTVDPDEWVHLVVWPELEVLSNVTTIPAADIGLCVDAVFVDGNHFPARVANDFETAEKVLRDGGLLIAHDTAHQYILAGLSRYGKPVNYATKFGIGYVKVRKANPCGCGLFVP